MYLNPALDNAADIPPAFFPDEATEYRTVPLARSDVSMPVAYQAPAQLPAVPPQALSPQLKALRIARAKTGETELRLLVATIGEATSYIVRKATIAPYKYEDEPLDLGNAPTEALALEAFEKRVAVTYPAEILRNKKTVDIHVDLL